ncbi:phosphoribosylformylglycinamidine synthase subunit PurS [Pontibacter sp. MBLB2868]|uniref:phosphoribosylformylglycinamidine synthase subunit PurS n=1 Tax=Pontibacter sp. MBLB2868 TaxID=3451555 RepID=UPI003F75413E
MKLKVDIDVVPRPELSAPQGEVVLPNLEHLGLDQVDDVLFGKHLTEGREGLQ